MPPPVQPASRTIDHEPPSQRPARQSPPAPRASINEESLFVTDDDEEDQVWGERNFDEDEGELKWVQSRGIELEEKLSSLLEGFCVHKYHRDGFIPQRRYDQFQEKD